MNFVDRSFHLKLPKLHETFPPHPLDFVKIFSSFKGRAKIVRKFLLHKNMLMIRSTINILPLVFTYFIMCLGNKKIIIMAQKTVTFLCKTVVNYQYTTKSIQLKKYKSIVNGLLTTASDKILYKLHLIFDDHPIIFNL